MIRPPKGYRIMTVGERLESGDLYYDDDEWKPARTDIVTHTGYGKYARKVILQSTPEMPKIDLRLLHYCLSVDDFALVKRIVNEETWQVRKTRPAISRTIDGQMTTHCAHATYVWRMVVFTISPLDRHQCMPVAAYFYLPKEINDGEIKDLVKHLDKIVDAVVNTVPATQWYGVKRWRSLLGEFHD